MSQESVVPSDSSDARTTKKVRVAMFSNHLCAPHAHGVATYANNLLSSLKSGQHDVQIEPVATWSGLGGAAREATIKSKGIHMLRWGRRMTPLAWSFLNRPRIERCIEGGADVTHIAALGMTVATECPLVITVHDIGPLTHPEYFSLVRPWVLHRAIRQLVRQASKIICVSQSTADELCRYTERNIGIQLEARIEVIHEGVSEFFKTAPTAEERSAVARITAQPYFLVAGQLSPRKNIEGAVRAIARLPEELGIKLLVVGGKGWDSENARRLIADPAVRDRVQLLGYVSEETLRALYHGALAYVHPTHFEGFGLTILEAMAAGAPVISSNVYSIPEVAGGAARLINPRSQAELDRAVSEVALDGRLRSELRARGLENVNRFCWDRCAAQTAAVYHAVRD